MKRLDLDPRPDWQAKVEKLGLIWHTAGSTHYWNEAACYALTPEEVDQIEGATADLYAMFLNAGQHVVDQELYGQFAIPEWCWPLISKAWNDEPPALNYGRFDLGFDGKGPPKLFEFNCDTPTSLLEAAVVQWAWKEDVKPDHDQFNSLHDKLVAKWRDIAPSLAKGPVHFTHAIEKTGEDAVTTAYLMDTAREAGVEVDGILVSDVGWDSGEQGAAPTPSIGRFVDLQNRDIRSLFHLYPWEWLVNEPFGRHIAETNQTIWIEPIWKMIWSNKAILPILWDLYPSHPNLLWASFHQPQSQDYVRKPILAREGANIEIFKDGKSLEKTDGAYGAVPTIFQGVYDQTDFKGNKPVVGSWIVDGDPAGVGIREDGLITGNLARFVPHIIEARARSDFAPFWGEKPVVVADEQTFGLGLPDRRDHYRGDRGRRPSAGLRPSFDCRPDRSLCGRRGASVWLRAVAQLGSGGV